LEITLLHLTPEKLAQCSGVSCFLFEKGDLFTAVGFLLALLTAIFGVYQYYHAQVWRRNEFLAKEIDTFFSDPCVEDILGMLDYQGKEFQFDISSSSRRVIVYHAVESLPERGDGSDVYLVNVRDALHHHEVGSVTYIEQEIRDRLDVYLSYLERFNIFIRNGLVTAKEVERYLHYHIRLLMGRIDHSQGYHSAFYEYVVRYNFDQALDFLRRFSPDDRILDFILEAQRKAARAGIPPAPPTSTREAIAG
jgi:hypothetical protein